MPEQPNFIRQYSKNEHAQERNELAAQIREARAERREASELSESAEQAVSTYKELDADVSTIQSSGVNRVKELFSWINVKARLNAQKPEAETSTEVPRAIEVPTPPQYEEPKKLLDDFYAQERKRWAEGKGTPEEMKQHFTTEHLTQLSMDDYALLLKRYPNAMVTHVTRQGIRDHSGMYEHSNGQGEYADGFMQIVQQGELKSALAITAAEQGKEAAVAKALNLDKAQDAGEAEERLEKSLSSAFDGYADRAAVHVATEAVADHYYGSERGNEIFLAFPSAHIAAEHNFVGNLSESRDLKHNDTWILRDDNLDKGLDINAAVAFVPAEARVDPITGSRYELDDLRRPIPNEAARAQAGELLLNPELLAFANEVIEKNYRNHETLSKLRERFNLDPRLQKALAENISEIQSLQYQNDPGEFERRKDATIDSIIESSGMRFKEAEQTVSSQEFWENYFSQHPEQRPSKLEYYKGDDPTAALLNWKKRHGLLNAGDEAAYDLGGRVRDIAEFESEDKDRFKSIAQKVIAERFPKQADQPEVIERIETVEENNIRTYPPPPPPPPPAFS